MRFRYLSGDAFSSQQDNFVDTLFTECIHNWYNSPTCGKNTKFFVKVVVCLLLRMINPK